MVQLYCIQCLQYRKGFTVNHLMSLVAASCDSCIKNGSFKPFFFRSIRGKNELGLTLCVICLFYNYLLISTKNMYLRLSNHSVLCLLYVHVYNIPSIFKF